MRIPKEKIEEIKRATDILEVLGDYLQLKKRGQNYWALSPFKTEKTPSFSVSPQKGIFKDFSSGKGGDAITFLMEVEGYTYTEALLYLARKYNIDVQVDDTPGDEHTEDVRPSLFALNKFAAQWFADQLNNTDEGRNVGLSYFEERGFDKPTIAQFQLGYSPEAWTALTDAALKQQFKKEFLLQTGLTVQKEDDPNRTYDRFRGRVIFPIHDSAGRIAGFGGRVLRSDAKTAKYVNSPESAVYNKSALLYGLYFARQALREVGECILVEGYADVVSLHQAGVKNVVASSGTSLTQQQIAQIARYARTIVVIYDADDAGIKAALRGIDLVLEAGLAVRAVQLPTYEQNGEAKAHDPDSYVRAVGGAAFKRYLADHALDAVAFKQSILQNEPGAKTPEGQSRLVHELARTVALMPDDVTRSLYVRRIAEQLVLPENVVLQAVNKEVVQRMRQARTPQPEARQPEETAQQPFTEEAAPAENTAAGAGYYVELELLRLMLNYPTQQLQPAEDAQPVSVLDYFFTVEGLQEVPFDNSLLERLRKKILDAHLRGVEIPVHELLSTEGPAMNQLVVGLLNFPHAVMEGWSRLNVHTPTHDEDLAAAARSAVLHFQRKRLAALMEENRRQLKQAADDATVQALLKRHRTLDDMSRKVAAALGIVVQKM